MDNLLKDHRCPIQAVFWLEWGSSELEGEIRDTDVRASAPEVRFCALSDLFRNRFSRRGNPIFKPHHYQRLWIFDLAVYFS